MRRLRSACACAGTGAAGVWLQDQHRQLIRLRRTGVSPRLRCCAFECGGMRCWGRLHGDRSTAGSWRRTASQTQQSTGQQQGLRQSKSLWTLRGKQRHGSTILVSEFMFSDLCHVSGCFCCLMAAFASSVCVSVCVCVCVCVCVRPYLCLCWDVATHSARVATHMPVPPASVLPLGEDTR